MPLILVFPNLAWLIDKICFWKPLTQTEMFRMVELPSISRLRNEEDVLEHYLDSNNI